MLFAISALDKPGHLDLRLRTRPAHLDYWVENDAALVLAGPYLDADGGAIGSLLVVKADDLAAAEALAHGDPYAAEGVFESVTIRPWNWVLKAPKEI